MIGRSLTIPVAIVIAFGACDDAAPMPADDSSLVTEHPSTPRPMLVEFSRDYCLPCQIMAPDVAHVQRKYSSSLDVVTVNLDREENARFTAFFQVETVPSQIYVDPQGKVLARHDGMASQKEMENLMASLGWVP